MTNHDFAARLHAISNFIEDLPDDIPTPTISREGRRLEFDLWWPVDGEPVADVMLRVARALGGTFTKNDPNANSFDEQYYVLTRTKKVGLETEVRITGYRDQVCTAVQVGTKTVEHAARPAREAYVEEVPVFEYDCVPLHAVTTDDQVSA